MNVTLLTAGVRLTIAIIAAALTLAAFIGRRRAPRFSASLALLAGLAVVVVIADRITVLLAGAAHRGDVLNDYAWAWAPPWGDAGAWLGIGLAVIAIGLGAAAGRRIQSPFQRALVLGLRIVGVGAALAVVLRPAIDLMHIEYEPNHVAVLIDVSQSMGLQASPGKSRLERAQAIIRASQPTFASWRGRHLVDFFTFSSTAVASSPAAIESAEASGTETRILGALQAVSTQLEAGGDLAGIILISDGVDTVTADPGTPEGLAGVGPVHTLLPAKSELRDIAVANILADGIAFVRTPITIEAVIKSNGFPAEPRRVTLTKDGQVIRQAWAKPAGSHRAKVSFELAPDRVGKHVLEIATPVAEGETVTTNNRRAFVLNVIRDKLRVLQVAGQPSWDVRALRGLLDQNPNIDLISFFILRTQEDVGMEPDSELSLIQFPTRELFEEALPTFDVVILQNFNYFPYGMGTYLDNIRDYVNGGGGLVMIGGALSFASGRYAHTPIASVLPVTLAPSASDLIDTEEFSPKLTDKGRTHPITALHYDVTANNRAWSALPPLEGINRVTGVRPGAAVLAVHPRLVTRDGKPLPVIVAGDIRDGRSLAITTDSLWRWQFWAAGKGDTGSSYAAFWENAIRWLTRDPDLRHLRVTARAQGSPKQPVIVDIELSETDYSPLAGGNVAIEIGPTKRPSRVPVETMTVTTGDDGRAHAEVKNLAPGPYRVTATADVGGRPTHASDVVVVPTADAELRQPAADSATLAAIAEQTGGRFLGDASAIPADLPLSPPSTRTVDREVTVKLWSRPGLLILALALLALEWALRRRARTL
ncbi:MAG TPA: glutamine amidotransferase [Kofleriaceae bacterium]|nr:glutamine amidotransferase [Kofleriaceae bacterium]